MANKVQGRNVIIRLLVDEVYYPVFCAKTFSFVQTQEVVEVTSVDSGNDREYEPGMTSTTVDISGVTLLDNTEGRISVLYLMQLAQRRARQTMRATLTDQDGGSVVVQFNAIITSNSFDKALGGAFSQSNTTLLVTGAFTIDNPIDPPAPSEVQEPLYIDAVEGEFSVSDPLLEQDDVEILHVEREGIGHTETAGTPGNREFRFTSGTGTIEFDSGNPFNAGEVIYILYQMPVA
jgi:hypothetical protein